MVEGVADDVDKVAATTACLFFGFLDGATTISESYGGGGGNYGDGTEAIGGRRAGGGPGSLCSTEVTVFVPPSTSVAVACAVSSTAARSTLVACYRRNARTARTKLFCSSFVIELSCSGLFPSSI